MYIMINMNKNLNKNTFPFSYFRDNELKLQGMQNSLKMSIIDIMRLKILFNSYSLHILRRCSHTPLGHILTSIVRTYHIIVTHQVKLLNGSFLDMLLYSVKQAYFLVTTSCFNQVTTMDYYLSLFIFFSQNIRLKTQLNLIHSLWNRYILLLAPTTTLIVYTCTYKEANKQLAQLQRMLSLTL